MNAPGWPIRNNTSKVAMRMATWVGTHIHHGKMGHCTRAEEAQCQLSNMIPVARRSST